MANDLNKEIDALDRLKDRHEDLSLCWWADERISEGSLNEEHAYDNLISYYTAQSCEMAIRAKQSMGEGELAEAKRNMGLSVIYRLANMALGGRHVKSWMHYL